MEGFDLRDLLNPEHWLAMDDDGRWFIFKGKPFKGGWCWLGGDYFELSYDFFNLKTCENWEDSLIQVKNLIKD